VSIGVECYVTLPKGQIIPTHTEDYSPQVPGGGHLLIVPINHYPTFSTIPADAEKGVVDEIERYAHYHGPCSLSWLMSCSSYKAALAKLYGKHGAVPVGFEVGRLSAKGGHAHVQMVPVPATFKDKIEETFLKEGARLGIDFEADPESALEACHGGKGSYFRVDLPNGKKMVHVMKDNVPFSIQFGRCVPIFSDCSL